MSRVSYVPPAGEQHCLIEENFVMTLMTPLGAKYDVSGYYKERLAPHVGKIMRVRFDHGHDDGRPWVCGTFIADSGEPREGGPHFFVQSTYNVVAELK